MSTIVKKELKFLDFHEFLASGFIMQNPANLKVYIGITGGHTNSTLGPFRSPFFQNGFEYFGASDIFEVDLNQLYLWIDEYFKESTQIIKESDSDLDFADDVADCLKWINSSDTLTKLVSVTTATYQFKNSSHPISKLKKLTQNLNGFIYGHWNDEQGILGVSPEPLFYQDEQRYYTLALAGTISTDKNDFDKIILEDSKEITEHQFVIKDIQNKLLQVANKISVHPTEVYNFGPIAHLRTLIEFDYTMGDCANLVNILGPTAALGGYPSKLCFEYLRKTKYYQIEKENRYFGGVYGLDLPGLSFGLVGIRNIIWNKDKLSIHSGSGIVQGSIVQNECDEVYKKRKSIEDIFIDE